MHLSLEEVTSPSRRNRRAQQRAFDLWRKEYNEDRPHEALKQRPPARAFVRSSRTYPCPLSGPEMGFEGCWVEKDGSIRWRRQKVFISTALFRENVEIVPTDADGLWEVRYGPIVLGKLDETKLHRGLIR